MKNEILRFRCTEELKNKVEKEAKENNLNISQYLEAKLLANTEPDLDFVPNGKITFSMPEQLGTKMLIENDLYELHMKEERLTDTFLNKILEQKNSKTYPTSFVLYDSNEDDAKPIELVFLNNSQIQITYNRFIKVYDVSFDEFAQSFIENVRKYAIYYAAPCNYKAFFTNSFDKMIEKMNKYRDKEKDILNKLENKI